MPIRVQMYSVQHLYTRQEPDAEDGRKGHVERLWQVRVEVVESVDDLLDSVPILRRSRRSSFLLLLGRRQHPV